MIEPRIGRDGAGLASHECQFSRVPSRDRDSMLNTFRWVAHHRRREYARRREPLAHEVVVRVVGNDRRPARMDRLTGRHLEGIGERDKGFEPSTFSLGS